jgi:hypothetical protein
MEPINLMNLYQNRLENPVVVYQSKSFQSNKTKKDIFYFIKIFVWHTFASLVSISFIDRLLVDTLDEVESCLFDDVIRLQMILQGFSHVYKRFS